MEPSCLAESNIITIFAFVFTKPQNCIKPQLYFYFLSATRLKSEKLPRKKCFCKITPHRAEADHLPLTGGNQIFASSSFPATSGHDERIPCHLVLADRFDNMNPFEKV